MAVELILSTDTLETGFRQKANASFGAIIVSATPVIVSGVYSGIIRLNCEDGSFISLDLTSYYYTQTQISLLLSSFQGSVYSGGWNNSFTGGYSVLDIVDHNGNLWRSNNNANTDEPGTSAKWTPILNIPPLPEILSKIPAGTAIPFNIDMTTGSRPLFGTRLTVLRQICKVVDGVTDDTKLIPYDDIQPVYNYTDNTYATLASIDIYGHPDGSGNFAEDTYITLKA